MSLYKRKDSPYWWVKISIKPPGQPARTVQESTGTADEVAAQEYHDRRAADLWREVRLKERPRMLWEQAVLRFLDETQHKRDHKGDKDRLRWLHGIFGGLYLDQIDRDVIDRVKAAKRGRAAGTVNRYLSTVRTILRKAEREWNWLEKAPHVQLLPEPKKRVRWITHEEARRLLNALPDHLAPIAAFSLATGVRQSNALGLEWSQIDMQRHTAWVYSDQAKGKLDLPVPLNADALAVLRGQIGQHDRYVFTYRGNRLAGIDSETWANTLKRARIANFRWHDLRHTWASWHVMAGTSLQELMELGGWRDIKMVLRYAHLSSEHLKKAAANVAFGVTKQLRCGSDLKVIAGGKDA